jgi:small subunit ribosomal protein S15
VRIAKLVQLEKQEAQLGDNYFWSCFASLAKPAKTILGQGLPLPTIMSLGTQMTPDYTQLPPQEELVEKVRFALSFAIFFLFLLLKGYDSLFEVLGCVVLTAKACYFLQYFHPDHMSSEEKIKLELHRVRDEFKMSENVWFCTSSKLIYYCFLLAPFSN